MSIPKPVAYRKTRTVLYFVEYLADIFANHTYAHEYKTAEKPHRKHDGSPSVYSRMGEIGRKDIYSHKHIDEQQHEPHYKYDAYRFGRKRCYTVNREAEHLGKRIYGLSGHSFMTLVQPYQDRSAALYRAKTDCSHHTRPAVRVHADSSDGSRHGHKPYQAPCGVAKNKMHEP